MDIKELMPFVMLLVLVGMIAGVGILILDSSRSAFKTPTAVSNETEVLVPGGLGTFANDDITSISAIRNASHNISSQLVDGEDLNVTESTGAYVYNEETVQGGFIYLDYTYRAQNPASSAMENVTSAVAPITNTWLTLIVTIGILAIILTLVIRSFAMGRK